MRFLATLLLFAFCLSSKGQTNVTPEQWLALQSRPNFKSGTKFPKLSRYGWPWTFELEREIATNWGFYIGVNGSANLDSSNSLATALASTSSVTYRVVTLASNFPSTYQLQVNLERNEPTNMSRGFFVTNSAGNFVDRTGTNEWADWTNATYTKVTSPEASEGDLQIQAQAITGPLKMLAGMAPIGIVINGGERDLGVVGYDASAWSKDPRVQATAVVTNVWSSTNSTGLSWPRYISSQKARHLRVLTDEIETSLTNSQPLYVWYYSGYEFNRFNRPGYSWENQWANWGWLSTNIINLSSNSALPVASSMAYYAGPSSFTNASGAAWNSYTDTLTHQLQWCGYIQGLGWRTNYSWVCGGWSNTDTNRLADIARYSGLLKMLTVAGSVGYNVGYYAFPTNTTPGSIFGNDGFGGSFPTNSPPHWLQQLVAASRVHAFSTHLDDFVLNSWLLPGNGAHFASLDAASCEFTNTIADPTLRVIARRRDNRPEWLVGAWASYGDARDATVNLTDYGPLTVNARPEGSVYWVTPDTVRLLDVDTTDPSQGVQTPDVIPSYRRIDWATYTGIPGGIPERNTVFTNMTGLDNTGATDVSAALNAALTACPSNQVVAVPAGTFLVTNQIWIPGGVTLRGASKTSTVFSLQRPAARADGGIRLGSSADLGASSMWTNAGTAIKGATNLTLLTATGLAVGNIVVIEQMNDTNLVFNYSQDGSSGSQDYHATTSLTNYCVAQLIKVLSVSGTNITFEPPLNTTFTNSLNCRLFRRGSSNWPRLATLESCTVSTPTNKFTTSWQRNVQFAFADEAGMKDVAVNSYERYGLYLSSAYRCTVQDCDFIGTNLGGSGGNYAIGLVFASAFNRIENNWTSNAITAVVIGEMSQGNAVLYNYEAQNYYSPTNWLQPSSSVHDCHPMYNLYEGNVFRMVGADMSHGNASAQTYLRNRLSAWQEYKTSQLRAAFIDYGHFNYNLVGNVMGGPQVPYLSFTNGPAPSEVTSLTNILLLVGYSTGDGDGPLGQTYTNSFGHTNVFASMLLKWNYIAGATDTTNGIPADQIVPALENSLVYESKPSYFGGLTWPPVNPSSPTTNYHALLIPAQYRYTGTEIPDEPQPPPPEQGGQTFRSVRMNVGTLLFK